MPDAMQEGGDPFQPLRCLGTSLVAGLAIAAIAFGILLCSDAAGIAGLVRASGIHPLALWPLWLSAGAGLGAVQFAFSLALGAAAPRPEVFPQGRMNS